MLTTRVALTALTLVSSALSFGAYTLLLKYMGASPAVDRLFFAGSIPLSVAGVMTGVLLYLLPPRLAALDDSIQEATLRVLSFAVLIISAIWSLIAAALSLLTTSGLFWALSLGFSNIACFLVLATLVTCLAQVRARYLITGLAPFFTSAGLFAGVAAGIAFHSEWLLAVGQWLGAAAGLTCLAYALRVQLRSNFKTDLRLCAGALAPLRPHLVSISLGTIAFTLFQPIDAALCTRLDSGSVSIMAYAQRVLVAVSTLVSMGAHVIAARTSVDALKTGGESALRNMANAESMKIVGFGLVVWIVYNLGGSQLLGFIFSASTMSETDQTRLVECVRWMLLGGGPMAAMPYLFRIFYTLQSYKKPALLGVSTATLYGALSWIMLSQYNIQAMAYAYSIVWWSTLLVALLWLNRLNNRATAKQ